MFEATYAVVAHTGASSATLSQQPGGNIRGQLDRRDLGG